MVSSIIIGLSSLAVTYVFLRVLLTYTHHDREPTSVATELPFISPLIGMAKKGEFYTDLRDKYNLPIYTLRLPGSRIYVVNSTALISAVQRQSRVLDFAPVKTKAAINVMAATPAAKEILHRESEEFGTFAYANSFDKAIHPALTPGFNLDALNRLSVQKVNGIFNRLGKQKSHTLNLYEWVRENIAWATTEGVYGPQNPFRDHAILQAFWKFEPGIITLMLQVLPSILARESIQAREKVVQAFIAYFNAGGHEQGSALIRARFQHSTEFNASIEDIARFEVGNAVAIMSNTTPSAFWALWHILSDATALEDCRNELRRLCKVHEDTVTLDITEVKLSCPMLLSTLQEVLRVHSSGISIRIVQEDHLLDGKYFLKKGATLMIPGPVQHTAEAIYGESVNEFDHKRFVRGSGKRLNPMGFRGFGGGSTLCPGRHFASTEIIAFVALMVLRFDVKPKSGVWVRPTTHKSGMHAVVPTPDVDVEVQVTPKQDDLAGKRWNVILTGSDKAVPIVAEDVDQE